MRSRPEPGSKREFEIWYEKSGYQFLRLAYFYTRDPKLAEDIAQEATAKVWKAWPDDQKREKILTLPGYVPTIVRHCFFDHLRVQSRTNQWEVELDVERHDRDGNGLTATCASPCSTWTTMSGK